jgi:hypothetical protein
MSDLIIVDGGCSSQTYVVIAHTQKTHLAVRPLVSTAYERTRAGKVKEDGRVVRCAGFRVHLQAADWDTMPSTKVLASFGLTDRMIRRENKKYWRAEMFIQTVLPEATAEYQRKYFRKGWSTLIECLLEGITIKATAPDQGDVLDWLEGSMTFPTGDSEYDVPVFQSMVHWET